MSKAIFEMTFNYKKQLKNVAPISQIELNELPTAVCIIVKKTPRALAKTPRSVPWNCY